MSWRSLALKNMTKNARRYFGYLLSSSVAVMVFFMFSAFILNPGIENGPMTGTARAVFAACQYVVIVFAVFFIFFFHAALLRLRGREMGLFTVLGMTPAQLGRLVFMESVLLGAAALVLGGGLGALFTKLFLLAMGHVLQLQISIPFVIPVNAVLRTVVLFGLVFVLEASWVAVRTMLRTPKALIVVNRERQRPPKASVWWMVLGLSCLLVAYFLAVFLSTSLSATVLPILGLTVVGTYLLFSQVLVVVLGWLRKRNLKGLSLLVVSRLTHRLKDNARVLTVVTILTAMVLSGMGSVFGMKSIVSQNAQYLDPVPLQLVTSPTQPIAVTPDEVRAELTKNHVKVTGELSFPFLNGHIYSAGRKINYATTIMSESTFEHAREQLLKAEPQLSDMLAKVSHVEPGHAIFVVPYPLTMNTVFVNPAATVSVGNGAASVQLPVLIDSQAKTRVLNKLQGVPGFMVIVTDADYSRLAVAGSTAGSTAGQWTAHGFFVDNWLQTGSTAQWVNSRLPKSQQGWFEAAITSQTETQQLLSIMLFAGFFISILFFLAAGTSLYFRLQVQQEADKRQFMGLKRIGVQKGEIGRLLTVEFLLFFGVPIGAALVHSTFAMIDFSHLVNLKGTAWPVFWGVVGIYIASMAVYFAVARVRYMRSVS